MQIVDDEKIVPFDLIHAGQIANGLLKCLPRPVMIQVSDVLADECLAIHYQGDGVLQVGADGQHGALNGQVGCDARRVSSGPSQNHGAESTGSRDRIIHAARDGTFANEEGIGDFRELPASLGKENCERIYSGNAKALYDFA